MKQTTFKILLVVLPVVVLCGIAEVWLRRVASRENKKNAEAWEAAYKDKPEIVRGMSQMGALVRKSDNPRIIYELRPNLDLNFVGARVTTSENGFRNPIFSAGSNTLRIVGLGDSSMFGWGVADDDTYLCRLVRYLNKESQGIEWEALNTAVPGYMTVMEVELLKEKCLGYQPDVVLIHFVSNDLRLPRFLCRVSVKHTRHHSYFIDWITKRMRRAPHESQDLFVRHPDDEPPEEFRDMVGEEAFRNAMRELDRLSREHDFILMIICNLWAPDYLQDIAKELKVDLIPLGAPMTAYMRKHRIKRLQGSSLTLSRTDPHYSARGHKVIAKYLRDRFLDSPSIQKRIDQVH